MRANTLRPEFVEFIPRALDNGILYISQRFQTASHLCCCGCGTKIVTPLRKAEYTLTLTGDVASLSPSIGNWDHPCQSHYWIQRNQVVWSEPMTKAEILSGRAQDDAFRDAYFARVAWPWYQKLGSRIKTWWNSLW